jgi:hypothetical protein
VHPDKLALTWRNGRSGSNFIAKRLDRFLVTSYLLSNTNLFSSVVVLPFVSDHAPILLKLDSTNHPKALSFKFNPHWLLDPDYNSLVQELWMSPKFLQEDDIQRRVNRKLKDLKSLTKGWVKRVRARELVVMQNLESDIKVLIQKIVDGSLIMEEEVTLIHLELERNKILKVHEDYWRLKSRVVWLQSGDLNTQLFHQYASHRRINKHLWEIRDNSGNVHKGQEEILKEMKNHCKVFYNSTTRPTIVDQVEVA